jgi:hypothetical protein
MQAEARRTALATLAAAGTSPRTCSPGDALTADGGGESCGDPALYEQAMVRRSAPSYLDFLLRPPALHPADGCCAITRLLPILYLQAFARRAAMITQPRSWSGSAAPDVDPSAAGCCSSPDPPHDPLPGRRLPVLLAAAAVALSWPGGDRAFAFEVGDLAKGWPVVLPGRLVAAKRVAPCRCSASRRSWRCCSRPMDSGRSFTGIRRRRSAPCYPVRLSAPSAPQRRRRRLPTPAQGLVLNVVLGWSSPACLDGDSFRLHLAGGRLAGALTAALLVGSPPLSAQFVMWPMPFVALTGRRSNGGRRRARLPVHAPRRVPLPGAVWWHTPW